MIFKRAKNLNPENQRGSQATGGLEVQKNPATEMSNQKPTPGSSRSANKKSAFYWSFFFQSEKFRHQFFTQKKQDPGINISIAILLVTSLLLKWLISTQSTTFLTA